MPGSMTEAIKRRQLRHIGNKAKIPSKHPEGDMGSGSFGRAASGQQASGGGGSQYKEGASWTPGHSTNVHVAIVPPGIATKPGIDMQENEDRWRTPAGNELPTKLSKGAMKRRARGKK